MAMYIEVTIVARVLVADHEYPIGRRIELRESIEGADSLNLGAWDDGAPIVTTSHDVRHVTLIDNA